MYNEEMKNDGNTLISAIQQEVDRIVGKEYGDDELVPKFIVEKDSSMLMFYCLHNGSLTYYATSIPSHGLNIKWIVKHLHHGATRTV